MKAHKILFQIALLGKLQIADRCIFIFEAQHLSQLLCAGTVFSQMHGKRTAKKSGCKRFGDSGLLGSLTQDLPNALTAQLLPL